MSSAPTYPVVVLVRHGQTDSNASGVLQGHLPTALNDLGHQQASRLAERLRSAVPRIECLISSDLRRAAETAAPIGSALGLNPEPDREWRERGFGVLEGRTLGDVRIWQTASAVVAPAGGEPADEFESRVERALIRVTFQHRRCESVAVVTHGGPMRMVLHLLATGRLPLPAGAPVPAVVPIANASLLVLRPEAGGQERLCWRVLAVNDVGHLEGLVTIADAG